MFDYQAGEKYRLTLIMVAVAGLLAGIFFSCLLMPAPEAPRQRQAVRQKWMDNPDVTGQAVPPGYAQQQGMPNDSQAALQAQGPGAAAAMPGVIPTDSNQAQSLVSQWLPFAFDLSAGTAEASQEKAMMYMTPECAAAYRQNVWTADLANQINSAGVRSSFGASSVQAGQMQPDGSVVVTVVGTQILSVPDKGEQQRPVNLEYMVKATPEGMKIAGISEAGQMDNVTAGRGL